MKYQKLQKNFDAFLLSRVVNNNEWRRSSRIWCTPRNLLSFSPPLPFRMSTGLLRTKLWSWTHSTRINQFNIAKYKAMRVNSSNLTSLPWCTSQVRRGQNFLRVDTISGRGMMKPWSLEFFSVKSNRLNLGNTFIAIMSHTGKSRFMADPRCPSCHTTKRRT